ncbi:Phosphatidate cytidylyltransferase [Thiorhodovibrio winogradskyi]|uniref:Phosphatidate cytidylyltransferase n=1 Tax=Thiorhodovibrio winogradskyi TaxID=77007 RepID=A0ABZ0SAX8_9GAMM|nr:phosphatidate cytidylyltransferase [Thiorhodovibrio winogradskyi]
MTDSNATAASGALRERFWTALMLALATAGAVLWLPTLGLAVALAPAIGLAAWELAILLGLSRAILRWAYLLTVLAVLGLSGLVGLVREPLPILLPVAVFWLLMLPVIFRVGDVQPAKAADWPMLLVSLPVISACWIGVLALHARSSGGAWMVLFLLMLVWLTDTGAYFAGRRFGRRKLAPSVSPGKTVEGVMGGLIAAGLWSLVLLPMAGNPLSWLWLVLLCMLTAGVSVVGDLLESWLKRRRNLKDAGSLLPGHGGMLDRVDSLLAAVPVFALGFLLWEATG